jgi:hypothetical protein
VETIKIEVTNIVPDNSANVSYKELETDFLLSYPKNIVLANKYLIIQDDRGHNFYYHGINKNTGLAEYEFGEKGNGPVKYYQQV